VKGADEMLEKGSPLLDEILRFRDERDWRQFHSPKNLAEAVAVEAGELLEQFLWLSTDESEHLPESRLQAVRDEIADIAIFVTYLCDVLNLDLERAVQDKVRANSVRYPVEKVRGVHTKYKELGL